MNAVKLTESDNFTLGLILNEEYTFMLMAISEHVDLEPHAIIKTMIWNMYKEAQEDERT